jgi:hypothetical protein
VDILGREVQRDGASSGGIQAVISSIFGEKSKNNRFKFDAILHHNDAIETNVSGPHALGQSTAI